MANNFPTIKPSLNLQFAATGILPPDVTFTRASSSGGYYDGKTVVKAEENLLLQSQTFDNAVWSKSTAAVTPNTEVAPDGTTTADTLVFEASNLSRVQRPLNGNFTGDFTFSIFLRVATGTLSLRFGDAGNLDPITVTDVWQRFTYTVSFSGTTPIWTIRNADAGGEKTFFIWGAQLEQRDSVTAYTPTTTQPITRFQPKLEYAIANEPVFDHNPVTGEALGLSIFEARTNLFLRSEEFDNAFWTKRNTTLSANQIIAPDGTLTMDKLVEDTSTDVHDMSRGISLSAVAHTFSVFAKAAERSYIWVRNSSVGSCFGEFNLLTGQITQVGAGATAKIENVGNGVYRCSITFTAIAGSNVLEVKILTDTNVISYTGDGVSGIYIWGAQLEVGAFATPYIPTVGSTVTRSADVAVMTGDNFSRFYRADEGAFVAEAVPFSTAVGNQVVVDATAGASTANQITLLRSATNAVTDPGALVRTNNVLQAFVGQAAGTWLLGVSAKLAASYKTNDFAESFNGSAVLTDTSVILPVVDRLTIGSYGTGTSIFNGYIKSLQFYPKALPLNLQAMTA